MLSYDMVCIQTFEMAYNIVVLFPMYNIHTNISRMMDISIMFVLIRKFEGFLKRVPYFNWQHFYEYNDVEYYIVFMPCVTYV